MGRADGAGGRCRSRPPGWGGAHTSVACACAQSEEKKVSMTPPGRLNLWFPGCAFPFHRSDARHRKQDTVLGLQRLDTEKKRLHRRQSLLTYWTVARFRGGSALSLKCLLHDALVEGEIGDQLLQPLVLLLRILPSLEWVAVRGPLSHTRASTGHRSAP